MDFQPVSTAELQLLLDNANSAIIDIRPVEAYNGWRLGNESRGGHIRRARSLLSGRRPKMQQALIQTILSSR